MNTVFMLGGVDMERWLAFRRDEPEAFAAFMTLGRDRVKFFEKPFVSWRNDVALFLGPRLAGYSAVDVEDLTTVELRSRELAVGHLEVYRAAAPGFFNAFLMLGAPQIGVRHSRRLTGVRKVTRQQWDTGHVWDDEIGVSTSLAPKFPNISVPYGALVPERLDNILGAGRHVACDASSHTFLREIPGSLAKPLALGLPSRRPPARDPATSRPAQSSANCSAKGSICRPRSKPPCSRLRPRSDVGTPKWSWLPLDYPPKRFERNFRGLASSLDAVREA
jgi:hypothetical protein